MEQLIHVEVGTVVLEGALNIPKGATALVLFAHGSGSSRHSSRNNFVAQVVRQKGMATLLIDLLSVEEDTVYETRFDIDLLTTRLITIIEWLKREQSTRKLSILLFGASTGAAAALQVAARLGKGIIAVVSRGGRPDLALDVLHIIVSPTLLIVGGNDFGVIELNQQAFAALTCVKKLELVPGATHLFEEPGALESVARLAANWFLTQLAAL